MATADKHKMEAEIWKSPPSLGTWWVEVSNFGRIRTLDHKEKFWRLGKWQTRDRVGSILKPPKDTRGRPEFFRRSRKGVSTSRLVRNLVAECFVPNANPRIDKYVFHKDGDSSNCRADNLVWGCHRYHHYICGRPIGIFHYGEKEPRMVASLSIIADKLGVAKQSIHNACINHRKCKGTELRYLPKGTPAKKMVDSFPEELYD